MWGEHGWPDNGRRPVVLQTALCERPLFRMVELLRIANGNPGGQIDTRLSQRHSAVGRLDDEGGSVLALPQRKLTDVPGRHVGINESGEPAENRLGISACMLRVGDEMLNAGRPFEHREELGRPDALEIRVSIRGSRYGIRFGRLSDSRR